MAPLQNIDQTKRGSMTIFKQFTFDSAHFLPRVPLSHKCREIHGHTYALRIYVSGPLHPELGWVTDFTDIKAVVDPVIRRVDHKMLNNIEGLENPTCELFAVWLWDQIKPGLPALCRIELNETPTSGVIYEGA